MERSLGLIETIGFVPAVEAGDAALKAAEVRLEKLHRTGRGLVTVVLSGDVSPIQAAVDAGKTAAARLGTVHSVTVIARQGEGVSSSLDLEGDNEEPAPQQVEPAPRCAAQAAALPAPPAERPTRSALNRLRVAELRRILRGLAGNTWSETEVRAARKKELIAEIIELRQRTI